MTGIAPGMPPPADMGTGSAMRAGASGAGTGRGSGSRRGPCVPLGGRAAHGVEPRPAPAAGSTIGGHMTAVLQAPGYRHALMRYCQLPGPFGPGRTNDVRVGS